jgi:hypothetical protein
LFDAGWNKRIWITSWILDEMRIRATVDPEFRRFGILRVLFAGFFYVFSFWRSKCSK